MPVLLLVFCAVMVGTFLVVVLAISAPRAEPVDLQKVSGGSPLVDLDTEQLGRLVLSLLDRMGVEIERCQGGKNEIFEIHARNPAPIVGGQLLVHCIPAPLASGLIDGRRIAQFIRAVRSAYVSKGLLFSTGACTPDAWREAEDAPIEIFDRDKLAQLIAETMDRDPADPS